MSPFANRLRPLKISATLRTFSLFHCAKKFEYVIQFVDGELDGFSRANRDKLFQLKSCDNVSMFACTGEVLSLLLLLILKQEPVNINLTFPEQHF